MIIIIVVVVAAVIVVVVFIKFVFSKGRGQNLE